ncbi:MAG: hypothetical protein ACOC8E_02810 [Planctomycetota bacterium]
MDRARRRPPRRCGPASCGRRMTGHRSLEPPLVQESEFASGLHVIANYGDEPYALAAGRSAPGRGSLAEE